MSHRSFGKYSTAEEVTAGLSLAGQTAVITGCNAGIGYETMRVLVSRGARVYGLARSRAKAQRACESVCWPGIEGEAIPFECEQTDFGSVIACANAIRGLGTAIDMLICNAGIYSVAALELAQGLEKQFVVNHLSHFVLVNSLLDRVKAARQGRIVVVGSEAHKRARRTGIEFESLSGQRDYDPRRMYGQSKLANGLFVRELARRLTGSCVTAYVVHPGWVSTATVRGLLQSYRRQKSFHRRLLGHLYQLAHDVLAKSPAQGAATVCYAATSPDLEKVSGVYLEDCRIKHPGGRMCDDALAAELWVASEQLTARYSVAKNSSASE